MPRLIDPGAGDAITLEALIDALESTHIDARDEDGFASLGPLLARLGRNPRFLADMAIAELKQRCAGQIATNSYGGQVFLLHPPGSRYVVRANFWPALNDAVTRASGSAALFYGMPHDHNFPFLTYGYLGPGYRSDDYERDPDAILGLPGETAGLRFVERSQLTPGALMLYRARRDVHCQIPPETFSVSLNILAYDPAQPWCEQYRFDLARNTVAEGLTVTPSEALVALAAGFGDGNGIDLASDFAAHHPIARMRVTALDALIAAEPDEALRRLHTAAGDPNRTVAAHARQRLARLTSATGTDAVAA